MKRQNEERRKAIKVLQIYFLRRDHSRDLFEANWQIHFTDLVDNCSHRDVPDQDKVMFFRYSLADKSDARQCYGNIMAQAKVLD